MRRPAMAGCRLSARQFDRMTPREVQWRLHAETERENREFERIAQLACWVVNPWISDRSHQLRVSKLLRRQMPGQVQGDDWQEWIKD